MFVESRIDVNMNKSESRRWIQMFVNAKNGSVETNNDKPFRITKPDMINYLNTNQVLEVLCSPDLVYRNAKRPWSFLWAKFSFPFITRTTFRYKTYGEY